MEGMRRHKRNLFGMVDGEQANDFSSERNSGVGDSSVVSSESRMNVTCARQAQASY